MHPNKSTLLQLLVQWYNDFFQLVDVVERASDSKPVTKVIVPLPWLSLLLCSNFVLLFIDIVIDEEGHWWTGFCKPLCSLS